MVCRMWLLDLNIHVQVKLQQLNPYGNRPFAAKLSYGYNLTNARNGKSMSKKNIKMAKFEDSSHYSMRYYDILNF